ncbi:thiamine phosphate synthase [Wenxinia marina]|uniref:Thiamine monophosphate synthase n=1 Tax=Wenxinia marina DSM 24838 TaxID=1123501 RepID=A0A0D0Q9N9_9RHOB|nr:thiamine phosphate synthase [Wenxinia marina]KIQ67738.1 Thiamine monophosphate synthase [Wenxinia marina DSM 24838]GGL77608.1 thiamine phosphate synthase [Wenxinia marina]
MTDKDRPQLYLISPPEIELAQFPDQLAACLDALPVACVRLALAGHDEERIARAADAVREVTEPREVALVLERHVLLARAHGLDGVHLTDGSRSVRAVRRELGDDAIVGAFCGQSRHDGLTAAELNADYVAFGPVGVSPLGDGKRAEADLFEWWSEMIEVPVVAEGALDETTVRALAPWTDFFGIGDEIWRMDDPAAALRTLAAAMG